MAAIDFSPLPTDQSLTLSAWIKAFGPAKFVVIVAVVFVLLCAIALGLPVQMQTYAEYLLAFVALIAVYAVFNANVTRELDNARSFAAANNFRFGRGQKVPRAKLPASVASFYTARTLSIRYRITGSIHDNPFTLYQVYGDYNIAVVHTKTNVTVLEAHGSSLVPPQLEYIKSEPMPGGVRVILEGNALSGTDMAAMFAAAGLIG